MTKDEIKANALIKLEQITHQVQHDELEVSVCFVGSTVRFSTLLDTEKNIVEFHITAKETTAGATECA